MATIQIEVDTTNLDTVRDVATGIETILAALVHNVSVEIVGD